MPRKRGRKSKKTIPKETRELIKTLERSSLELPFQKSVLQKAIKRKEQLSDKEYQKALLLVLKSTQRKEVDGKERKAQWGLGYLKREILWQLISMDVPLDEIVKETGMSKWGIGRIFKKRPKPEVQSEAMKKRWEKMSPKEKEKMVRKRLETLEAKTPEEKEAFRKKLSERVTKWWKEMSDEERKALNRKKSEAVKKQWEEMSPEERESRGKKMSEVGKKRWEKISEEKKEDFRKKISEIAKKRVRKRLPPKKSKVKKTVKRKPKKRTVRKKKKVARPPSEMKIGRMMFKDAVNSLEHGNLYFRFSMNDKERKRFYNTLSKLPKKKRSEIDDLLESVRLKTSG